MSFDIVRNTHAQAAKLFHLLCFLNPNGILIEFLLSGVEALESDLREVVLNRSKMAKALLELEKFSLIKWDRPTKLLFVHRLIQTVVQDEMSDTELTAILNTVIDLCNQSLPLECTNETRHLCRIYQSQVVGPLLHIKALHTQKFADVMERVGKFLMIDGKYKDSERLLLRVVEMRIEISGTDHPSLLISMTNLAGTYRAQGRMAEAAMLVAKVLEKAKRILGEDHLSTLASWNNLAGVYGAQGRTAEAATLHEEVLGKTKRILSEDHPDTLRSMSNLALTYALQGRTGEAAALHEEVLEEMKRILGEDDLDMLNSMSNLAFTYQVQERTAEASALHEEVLRKQKQILVALL